MSTSHASLKSRTASPLPPVAVGSSTVAGVPALHSAWNPYAVLPPATKRRLDPQNTIPSKPYAQELGITDDAVADRITNKFLQLDPPEGKLSDWRKKELETAAREKEKKRRNTRAREEGCGLIGRRKRASLGKEALNRVSYAGLLSVHAIWLGYMAELLQLPIAAPPPSASTSATLPSAQSQSKTTTMYPTFPSRRTESNKEQDVAVNVQNAHAKLVKAEFVGAVIRVKRGKNPSLVGLEGILLQETQSTFKIVTSKSKVKILPKPGSIFTFALPLTTSKANLTKEITFDIYGDAFCYRSAERVGRKWKAGTGAGGIELI